MCNLYIVIFFLNFVVLVVNIAIVITLQKAVSLSLAFGRCVQLTGGFVWECSFIDLLDALDDLGRSSDVHMLYLSYAHTPLFPILISKGVLVMV